jgi:hypothetical protein
MVHEVNSPTVTNVIAKRLAFELGAHGFGQSPAKNRRRDICVQDDEAHARPDRRDA